MTDLLNYQKRVDQRKQWNRNIANFGTNEKCKLCSARLIETKQIDEINGVEYYLVCQNPDCPKY